MNNLPKTIESNNHKKTVGIQFGKHKQCNITTNGSKIEWQRSVKHLGNTINSRLSDDDDCKVKCSVFMGNVIRFIGNYSNLNNTLNVSYIRLISRACRFSL